MNGKKIAALLLVMIIASIAYGTQIMQKQASAMRTEATTRQGRLQCGSQEARKNKCIELKRIDGDCKDLRQFLKRWTPVIEHITTGQEADQALMTVVRNSGILVLSQKFEVKESRGNPLIAKTLQGTLVIQDDYGKTLNWFGDLERKLPLIRVNACRIKPGENGRQVNMEVHLEIPLVNLEAEDRANRRSKPACPPAMKSLLPSLLLALCLPVSESSSRQQARAG